MNGSCRLCRFWRPTDHGNGECRRFPPLIVARPQMGRPGAETSWPRTNGGDVCGEFKEKP